MNKTLLITRHGLSAHNLRTDFFMGRSPDADLLPQGHAQARALGLRLGQEFTIDAIVASSLPRTMDTARTIRAAMAEVNPQAGEIPLHGEDAFWELSKGEWEGVMPRANLPQDIAGALRADPHGFRYPGGESYADVEARVGPAFDRWAATESAHTMLFVLHGDVIRSLMRHLLDFPPHRIGDYETSPCGLTVFRSTPPGHVDKVGHNGAAFDSGNPVLVHFNDASHLKGLTA